MSTRTQLNRLFAKYGGLAGVRKLLKFAQRQGTLKPSPSAGAKPLKMPPLTDKGKGERK